MRGFKTAVAFVVSVSLTGCASMFHGTSQQVSIRSNIPDAKLYVNEAFVGTGNGVTSFHKNKNYTIVARKDGWTDGIAVATKSFDPITLLGLFIDWGVISILIVDGAATGSWSQFDQTSYVIDPQPKVQPEEIKKQDSSLYSELKQLGELRDKNILSEEEFQMQKKVLLEKIK